jgi:hypothetical protein
MRIWIRGAVAILVLCAVFAASRWAHAQTQTPQTATPTIISGGDVGFRVDIPRTRVTGKLHGQWVIRVNGEWFEPDTTTSSRLLMK